MDEQEEKQEKTMLTGGGTRRKAKELGQKTLGWRGARV